VKLPLCQSLRAHPSNQIVDQIRVFVALYQSEIELEADDFGDFVHQVHGVADVAGVSLQIPYGYHFRQEGLAL
jgi:hypothetical protein